MLKSHSNIYKEAGCRNSWCLSYAHLQFDKGKKVKQKTTWYVWKSNNIYTMLITSYKVMKTILDSGTEINKILNKNPALAINN